MSRCFYVYALYQKFKHKPFYIGKGKGNRHLEHLRVTAKNPEKNALVQTELAQHGYLRYRILVEGLSESKAFHLERQLIEKFGRLSDGTGCLTNRTSGGGGVSGYEFTEADRYKLKRASVRRWSKPEERAANGKSVRLRYEDPIARERQSAAVKKRYAQTPVELRAKHRTAISKARSTPSAKLQTSLATKKSWAKTHEQRIESIRKVQATSAYRANCSAGNTKAWKEGRRKHRFITFQGKRQTLKAWSEQLGIASNTLSMRLDRYCWPVSRAFTTPT